MKIVIEIKGINHTSLVVENETINNEKEISKEEINNLLRIIRLWKKEYGTGNGLDLEEFYINVDGDVMHGKGVFPSNYHELKEWVNKNA